VAEAAYPPVLPLYAAASSPKRAVNVVVTRVNVLKIAVKQLRERELIGESRDGLEKDM